MILFIKWFLESLGISPLKMILGLAVAGGITLACGTAYYHIRHDAYQSGYAQCQTEITKETNEKVKDAKKAGASARACFDDPKCRLSDDGYKRAR